MFFLIFILPFLCNAADVEPNVFRSCLSRKEYFSTLNLHNQTKGAVFYQKLDVCTLFIRSIFDSFNKNKMPESTSNMFKKSIETILLLENLDDIKGIMKNNSMTNYLTIVHSPLQEYWAGLTKEEQADFQANCLDVFKIERKEYFATINDSTLNSYSKKSIEKFTKYHTILSAYEILGKSYNFNPLFEYFNNNLANTQNSN